jgi:hypothetical protein
LPALATLLQQFLQLLHALFELLDALLQYRGRGCGRRRPQPALRLAEQDLRFEQFGLGRLRSSNAMREATVYSHDAIA